jgi:hypothetical protein
MPNRSARPRRAIHLGFACDATRPQVIEGDAE